MPGCPQKRGILIFGAGRCTCCSPEGRKKPGNYRAINYEGSARRARSFSLNYRAYVHTAVTALTCPGADTDTRLSVNFLIAEIVRPSALRFLRSFACRGRIIALIYGSHES